MSKQKLETTNIVTCAIYIVIGILLCAMRMELLNILMTIIGALFLICGIYDLAKHITTRGAVEVVIGVAIIVCGWTIAQYVLLVFGILLAIKGICDLAKILQSKIKDNVAILSACITLVIGVILCVAPFAIGDIICIIVGVAFVIDGVLALLNKKA